MTQKDRRQTASLKISGKKLEIPSSPQNCSFHVRPGGWIIAEAPGPPHWRRRFMMVSQREKAGISLGGRQWSGEWVLPQRTPYSSESTPGSEADLTSQFPGKVRKILVQEGALVSEGDSLVLVEAMKMEFSIKAPYSGKVKKIHVQENQPLSPGDQLVELEATSGE